MSSVRPVKLPEEPITLGELEDFLVYEMGIDRSKIVVKLDAVTQGQVILHIPFEQH